MGKREAAEARGEIGGPVDEAQAWAIMGMNVFLGLRYGIWAAALTHGTAILLVAMPMLA